MTQPLQPFLTRMALLFFGLLFCTPSSAQWSELASPTTSSLYGIQLIDENIAYAIGDNGTIIKTENGGDDWTNLTTGTTNWFFALYFTDADTGYGAGVSDEIYKTTDGGQNWVALNTGSAGSFIDVFFLDANIGFASGDVGAFIKTTDGGNNWTVLNNTGMVSNEDIYFLDENSGFIAGRGIAKTTDGGQNWTQPVTDGFFYSILFVNDNVGFASGTDGEILKTTDGGDNWTTMNSNSNTHLRALHFIDENTGYVCGGHPTQGNAVELLKTTDGGANWSTEDYPAGTGFLKYLNAINFTENKAGMAAGMGGRIIRFINPFAGNDEKLQEMRTLVVYPNPNNGTFHIQSSAGELLELKVLNNQGQLVHQQQIKPFQKDEITLPNNLKEGIYLIHYQGKNTSSYKKMILQRN